MTSINSELVATSAIEASLSEDERWQYRIARMEQATARRSLATRWRPQHRVDCKDKDGGPQCHCPQVAAYQCLADVVGYGGAAGGGKSDLLLGKAGNQHRRSIIFRRVFPSMRGMIDRSREIFNLVGASHLKDSFNESLHVWRLSDGRMIEFGSAQYEPDLKKYQGQPHDFIGVDEATEFPEKWIRFLSAWLRTTVLGQPCQLALTFNPPMDESGNWIIRYFAPWLDEHYPNHAEDGEVRWFAMLDGREEEVPGPEPIWIEETKELIRPKSRTFYHASLGDNPALMATDYGSQIDALDDTLRSLLKGNFNTAKLDNPWQVIPLAWIKAAQARWTERPPLDEEGKEVQADTTAADIARGGKDRMSISRIHEWWFAPIEVHEGREIPDGPTAAALLQPDIEAGRRIGVDVIGVGSSPYDSLVANGAEVLAINNSESAKGLRDRTGRLKFQNVRAASYWALREALDPDPTHEGSEQLALPPDTNLVADLCAPKFSVTTQGILIEPKKAIQERLGRSPDEGDSVVMAWWTKLHSRLQLWP